MPATYEPIASQTLGSSAADVTFSSISGTFTDLMIVCQVKLVSGQGTISLRVNSDTGTNYSRTLLEGYGTGTYSDRTSSQSRIDFNSSGGPRSNSDFMQLIHLMSYSNTNVFKTVLGAGANSSLAVDRTVGLWRSTSAITSVTIYSPAGNLASGSTFALYGIKAA